MDPVLLAKITRQIIPGIGGALTMFRVLDGAQAAQLTDAMVAIVNAASAIVGPALMIGSLAMVVFRHFRPTPAMVAQVKQAPQS